MANSVRLVLVESLDRLARDLLVQSTLLAKLECEGIALVSASTGEDVTASMRDDPMRKALVQIQGVFAELDKSLLVRKLRKGREAKRVVATVKALRRKPKGGRPRSYQKIGDILNANAIPPRAGAKWHASSARNVCRGAAYRAARVRDALVISLGD